MILFEVSLVLIIIIKFLIKFYFIAENLAKIVLPLLTIFLFKRIFIWYLCRYFLTNNSKSQKTFFLKNRKFYFILNHFNFFFDCFLGSFVCFMRMAKSSIAAVFFMPRLDYSIFGRYLEKTDMGFISYVTFIHMEVNQTHPVKLAFCEIVNKSQRECCENKKNRRVYRNKWFIAYTLIKNPFLKKERKRCLYLQSLIPRVESFEQFLERHVKTRFFNDDTKKKSKSTPCLVEELKKCDLKEDNMTSTIKSRALPPVPAKRNNLNGLKNNLNFSSTETYNPYNDYFFNSSRLTDNTTLNFINQNKSNLTAFSNSTNSSHSYFPN